MINKFLNFCKTYLFPEGTFRRRLIIFILKKIKKIKNSLNVFILIIFNFLFCNKFIKKIKRWFIWQSIYKNDSFNKKEYIHFYINEEDDQVYFNLCNKLSGNLAVHLHLYYVDLLQEFKACLSNIPYEFDLFVSVPEKKYVKNVYYWLNTITFVNRVFVKNTKNFGRDYGPLFVDFCEDIKKYKYLIHIQSKKSLRMGNELYDWRRYMIENLLGSKEKAIQRFSILESSDSIGLIYTDSIKGYASYWAHTWLSNIEIANEYFSRFNYIVDDSYLSFPAGSFFMCKVESIRYLFDLDLSYDDFGIEQGKDEGTLAHTIERGIGEITKFSGYSYVCYIPDKKNFYKNFSIKNIDTYSDLSVEKVISHLSTFQTISFSVFNLFFANTIYNDNLFYLFLDEIISKNFNIEKYRFFNARQQACKIYQQNYYDIYKSKFSDIYQIVSSLLCLDNPTIQKLKNLELEYAEKTLILRKDVKRIYDEMVRQDKRIIFVSDTNYTIDEVKSILSKFHISKYSKIYLSSELRASKYNGDLWDYVLKDFSYDSFVHVGNNELSDLKNANIHKIRTVHLIDSFKLFQLSRASNIYNNKLKWNIYFGLIINKGLCNSPFSLNSNARFILKDYKQIGYSFHGPLFVLFLLYCNKQKNMLYKNLYDNLDFNYMFDDFFSNLVNFEDTDSWFFKEVRKHIVMKKIINFEYDKYGKIDINDDIRLGAKIFTDDFLKIIKNIELEFGDIDISYYLKNLSNLMKFSDFALI